MPSLLSTISDLGALVRLHGWPLDADNEEELRAVTRSLRGSLQAQIRRLHHDVRELKQIETALADRALAAKPVKSPSSAGVVLSQETRAAAEATLATEGLIFAIKLVREATGCSLRAAKDAVETMRDRMATPVH